MTNKIAEVSEFSADFQFLPANNRQTCKETGSQVTAHTTIQSSRTSEAVINRRQAVVRVSCRMFFVFPVSAGQ
jgi:hypothetical protein